MKFSSIYVADYENTTNTDNTYVYGFGIMELKDKEPTIVNTLDESIELLKKLPSKSVVYFHNFATYDGWIILYWLLENGYTYTTDKNVEKRFNGIITDDRQIYQLRVRFNKHFVEFRDTCKLVAGKLDTIGKNFKCPTSKLVGTIDYDKKRGPGYVMTETERNYLRNDVVLLKEIVEKLLTMGTLADFITCGGYAFSEFKHSLYQQVHGFTNEYMEGKRLSKWYKKDLQECFRNIFPELPLNIDAFCRHAYKGGYCINWSDGEIYNGHGLVLDVNSLYPSVLRDNNNYYPYGEPIYFKDVLPNEKCFIVHIVTRFSVKPGHLPFIQIKNNPRFVENEYIHEVYDEVDLWLTSVDLELFYEQYDVHYMEVVDGYYFKSYNHFFDMFIDTHYEAKKNAKDPSSKAVAKICLNSSYGRFGQRIVRQNGIPYISGKNTVSLNLEQSDDYPSSTYIPVACFCTSYARRKTIQSGVQVIEKLRYIDTDSLHLVDTTLEEVSKIFDIDPKELGFWDCESEFDQARWVRQKTYIERNFKEGGDYIYKKDEEGNFILDSNGEKIKITHLNIKACGLTDDGKEILKGDPNIFLNFTYGLCLEDSKLMKKTVKGGVTLVKADFNIRK